MNISRPPEPGSTEGTSRQNLLRIYEQTETIAVVGASANEHKAAHVIPSYLQSQGYRIIPVNPKGGEILGERVYPSLEEIDVAVDVVDVFRPPAEAEAIAREAIAIGAHVLWFQPGTYTADAIQLAADAGLDVVSRDIAWVQRTANWGSERGHLEPLARRDLRSHDKGEQLPDGSRFRPETILRGAKEVQRSEPHD